MGFLKDLGTSHVYGIDKLTGFPKDEYGRLLDKTDPYEGGVITGWYLPGTKLYNLTNPYGFLEFAMGTGDDFVCFDYNKIETEAGTKFVILDATVNSETGSFIEGFGYHVAEPEVAAHVAKGMTFQAMEWCMEIRHSKKGWNQDEFFFYRSVYMAMHDDSGRNFSDRQMRLGGKKINKFTKVEIY